MILALLLLSSPTTPSFDCAKASLEVERMICADPDLALRDRAVALIYGRMSKSLTNVPRYQRKWLRETRNACRTSACVREAYDSHIALWAGTARLSDYWRHQNYVGGLTIAPVAGDWHVFSVGTAGEGPDGKTVSAELAGLVEIKDDVGRWRQGPNCSLAIARRGRQWRVDQDPGCAPVLRGLSLSGYYFTEADWRTSPLIDARIQKVPAQ